MTDDNDDDCKKVARYSSEQMEIESVIQSVKEELCDRYSIFYDYVDYDVLSDLIPEGDEN